MGKYHWTLGHDNLTEFQRLVSDAVAADMRRDRDAYDIACEEIRRLPGFPSEADPLRDIILVYPSASTRTIVDVKGKH